MMCMSWVNTWCPAWALLWVLSSQSSCLSSAPSGHGRGKAELAERLLPLLHFQGAVLGAHTALPKLPGWPFCQLWIASPGSGSLPEIPSAHWPRGSAFIAPVLCHPQTGWGLSTSISSQRYFSIVGVQWEVSPKSSVWDQTSACEKSQEFQSGRWSGCFSPCHTPAHRDLTELLQSTETITCSQNTRLLI